MTVRQKSRLRNIIEEVKVGKLFMIDLAGSERAANTQVSYSDIGMIHFDIHILVTLYFHRSATS